jgi:hypothetical protein
MRRLLLVFLVALPTLAFADVLSETPAPRPMLQVTPRAKPAAAKAPVRQQTQLSLAALPSPSVGVDPGECRMTCAQTRYACDAVGGAGDCPGAWSRCVATCVSPSLDPGFATAP